MPYIKKADRAQLERFGKPLNAGELNYSIHELLALYLENHMSIGYREMNEVLGVLDAVRQEFYRRIVAPYEDTKIQENGDVTLYERFARG